MALDEYEKVPLHMFEKAKKREVFFRNALLGMFWSAAVIVGGALFTGFVLLVVFAFSHPAAWVPIGVLALIGVLAFVSTQYSKNQKIVAQGQSRGVIDE